MNIGIISGSNRPERLSHRVAMFLEKRLKETTKHNIILLDVREAKFDLFSKFYTEIESPTDSQKKFKEGLYASNALIFVSPEYNGGFSPAFKNALDHFGKDAYYRKPIAVATSSPGSMGGIRVAHQLQLLSIALFAIPCPQMLIIPEADKKFNEEGILLDNSFDPNVNKFLSEYLWLAESVVSDQ